MLHSLKEQHTSLSEELYITLKNRTEERHIDVENVLKYLRNYNDFKSENEKEEKRVINSNLITFIVSFLKMLYQQTYFHSEEFGTAIKDDPDINVDSEKELSLE
ncbi:uncharacterized protein TNCV_4987601 [Trichonephila clavipes]|nr:uncharacterized protein TNCV_4987601 [Trichonephila clavipes]